MLFSPWRQLGILATPAIRVQALVVLMMSTIFLNAVAASDPHGLFNPSMATDQVIAGIARSGSPGSYRYSVISPAGAPIDGASSPGNRPIAYVSWFDAARFANWMHNGGGSGGYRNRCLSIEWRHQWSGSACQCRRYVSHPHTR